MFCIYRAPASALFSGPGLSNTASKCSPYRQRIAGQRQPELRPHSVAEEGKGVSTATGPPPVQLAGETAQPPPRKTASTSGTSSTSSSNSRTSRQQQRPLPPPPQQPLQGRGPLLATAAAALSAVGAASYSVLSSQPQLPPVQDVLGPVGALVLGGPPLGLLLAKALLGDLFHVELHRGRLYLTTGVPSQGPAAPRGAIDVRPTGDVRGNGAFAAASIPRGAWLGDYTGELLDRRAFYARYPDGVGDYAAAVDDEWTIDAVVPVANTAKFHPVHMNHSRGRANVRRYYARGARRISFFTTRDVEPGEELLYDYGWRYWRGREHMELP